MSLKKLLSLWLGLAVVAWLPTLFFVASGGKVELLKLLQDLVSPLL